MIRLKQCREQRGMSQKYVALSLGVSAPTVSMWETGRKKPTLDNIISLADLFGVTVDYLLERTESHQPPEAFLAINYPEAMLLQMFRQLTEAGQSAVTATARAMLEQPGMRKEPTTASAM